MNEPKNAIEIVKLCQKGDKQGFYALVDIYSKRIFGYFYRLTGNNDEANELLSELFLKVVEKIGSCRAENFDGWLFKLASNLFADHIRAKKRQEKMLSSIANQIQTTDKTNRDNNEMIDKLTEQLKKLDKETAEIIVMRYYSGLSFEELAKLRNEPIGTCLSKVHRGLKKLKQLMEENND